MEGANLLAVLGVRTQKCVGIVAGGPGVLRAVAGAMAKRESICEVSNGSFDPPEGESKLTEQTVERQWDEEARCATLRLQYAVLQRRGVAIAPLNGDHRQPARRIQP